MPNSEPLLTTNEVAARCKVHPETVRRWTRDKLLSAVILPSGHKRYRASDVETLTAAEAS